MGGDGKHKNKKKSVNQKLSDQVPLGVCHSLRVPPPDEFSTPNTK